MSGRPTLPRRIGFRVHLPVFALIFAALLLQLYSRPLPNPLTWDALGYYLYLPLTLIYDDPAIRDLDRLDELNDRYDMTPTWYQLSGPRTGNRAIKYQTGLAQVNLPFFLAGHAIALATDYPADGFSKPYQWSIIAAYVFWFAVGTAFLLRLLTRLFGPGVAAAATLLAYFGTNMFHASYAAPGMPHVPLFAFSAVFLYYTMSWHEHPGWKNGVLVGLSLALAVVIRPTVMFLGLVFLTWGAGSLGEAWEKARAIARAPGKLAPVVLGAIPPVMVQLAYWKAVTGQWLYNGYDNPGEGFDLLGPHTLDFLFSFRKGWLLYTPLMVLLVPGLYVLWKRHRPCFLPVAGFLAPFLYLVSSWSTWWYAASFSQRTMIEAYAVLAIPLAALYGRSVHWSRVARTGFYALSGAMVILNLFQTWQYDNGIIHPERMTRSYYWEVFGKTAVPPGARDLLLVQRSATPGDTHPDLGDYRVQTLVEDAFSGNDGPVADDAFTSPPAALIAGQEEFSRSYRFPYSRITDHYYAWIRVSFDLMMPDPSAVNAKLVIHFDHDGGAYKYFAQELRDLEGAEAGTWRRHQVHYLTPEIRDKDDDELVVYFWNPAGPAVLVGDLKIEALTPGG